MLGSLALTAPELILSLGAIALLMVAAFMGERSARLVSWLAVGLLAVAALALLGPAGRGGIGFDGLFVADAFATFAKVLIFIAAAVAIIAAQGWFVRGGVHKPEYPILILLSTAGAGIMVSATDLLMLYVGLELQSLSSYVLASFLRRDERSVEAGLKYFVLGSLASGILLYGISLLYGFTGSTQFSTIFAAIGGGVGEGGGMSLGELFGLVFVMAGLAFKIAAVPFHMWTPDVYEGAPTPVTALFATAQKVAAVALLCRVSIEALGPATDAWRQIVIFSALASIVLGAVAAYGQTNIQ
ncbi:MAG: NADH-ubiquinone oxidoreductase chain N, partial [uncultured Sphingomonadaceae bacterium]